MQILAMFEAGTKFLGTFDTAGFFGEGLAGSNSHHLNILNKSNIVQHMLCDRSIQKPCVNCTFAVKNPCCLSFAFKTRWPAMTSRPASSLLWFWSLIVRVWRALMVVTMKTAPAQALTSTRSTPPCLCCHLKKGWKVSQQRHRLHRLIQTPHHLCALLLAILLLLSHRSHLSLIPGAKLCKVLITISVKRQFHSTWVNFWGNSLWTHSDTMNIYKCTTWLGTHLLFCADSTAGLISCRRDFGRSKMHTTPDIHLGIMRIMHSPLYLPRISQDQIYLLKKFSRSLPESLLNDLICNTLKLFEVN